MSDSQSIKQARERQGNDVVARLTSPQAAWAFASLAFTATILVYFHDRTWWPPDDGVYGYVAQRILAGDVLNGNLRDIHAGYVNFLHAAALWMFGEDLVSLRYPLVALTLLQSAFAYRLLLPRGPAYAALGAAALGALSFVLFPNPSANWYALFFAFAAILLLAETPTGDVRREVALGALLMVAFLFRQLSGVFLAIGVLTWLLIEPRPASGGRPIVARILAAIMGLGVAGYVWSKGSADGTLLFGLWPLAFIGMTAMRTRLGDAAALRLLARLAFGGALAALPLLAYHVAHGSLHGWVEDALLAALQLTKLDFMDQAHYWHIAAVTVAMLGQSPNPAVAANGLFWLLQLIAPTLLGLWLLAGMWRGEQDRVLHPLPVVALFYAQCSAHYEIPIYLIFTSGLTIIALMWLLGAHGKLRSAMAVVVFSLAAIALPFQAGQTTTRGFAAMVAGGTVALDAPEGLPGARIAMERSNQAIYQRLMALIDAHSKPGDAILALPFNPELYFLSHRRSVFDFYITALGIRSDADLAEAIQRLAAAPPPIIIDRPSDKYSNWASDALMVEIKRRYRRVEQVGLFDVYLPR